MNRKQFFTLMCFWPLALVVHAQPAINSGANESALPMHNLMIEVRQLQSDQGRQATLGVEQGRISGALEQGRNSTATVQQVLVLNGRPARIAVQAQTPLRLLQQVLRGGQILTLQSMVLIEAGTGFSALPRWNGAQQVDVELNTQQALRPLFPPPGMAVAPAAQASVGSNMVLPLGEWVTVAESEQSLDNSRADLRGAGTQTGVSRTEVQLRISVR